MKTEVEIFEYLRTSIEEITFGQIPAEQIRPDDQIITDLGLDSLDYATLLLSCEKWVGIKVNEDDVNWSQIRTVLELARFIFGQQQLCY